MKLKKLFIGALIIFSLSQAGLFSQSNQTKNTEPKPYSEDEFIQPLEDLRRFEIITLGSMPFITLNTAIVFKTLNPSAYVFNLETLPSGLSLYVTGSSTNL